MPIVEMAFTSGLDQGTDPRRTVKLTALDNYVWTKRGMIEKRPGYTTLVSTVFPLPTSVVTAVNVTAGGSGYQANAGSGVGAFFVTFTGGGGAGALATAFTGASGGAVTSIGVAFGGSGFSSAPAPSFALGSGSGATATAVIGAVSGGSLSAALTIATSPQGVLQTSDGTSLYAYDGSSSWSKIGALPNVAVATRPVPLQAQPTQNGVTLINAVDWISCVCGVLRIWWTYDQYVIQGESGATLATVGASTESITPMALATDGTQWVWFFYVVSGHLGGYSMAPTPGGGTLRSIVTFPAGLSPPIPVSTWMDAVWNPVTGQLNIAYYKTGGTGITVESWAWSAATNGWVAGNFNIGVNVSSRGTAFTLEALSLSAGASGTVYLAFAYVDTAGSPLDCRVETAAINGATGAFTAVEAYAQTQATVCTAIENVSVVETGGAGAFTVAFTLLERVPSNTGLATNTLYAVSVASGAITLGTKFAGGALGSRLWAQGTRPCAVTYHVAAETNYVHDLTGVDSTMPPTTPPKPLAIFNAREAFSSLLFASGVAGVIQSPWALPAPLIISPSEVVVPTTIAPEPATSSILDLQLATVNFAPTPNAPANEWTSLLYPAGVPTVAGVASTFEAQFMAPPVIVLATVGGSGGALSSGNYEWVATYAHVFEDGSIIEGPPSAPVQVKGVTAGQTATLVISQYGLTPDAALGTDALTIVIVYRTQANGTDLTRVVSDPFTSVTSGAFMPNNPQFNALAFTDNFPDTAISGNVALYTEGGVFDNVCPDTCTYATRVRDRVYLAGSPDGFTVYYSDSVQNAGTTNFHDEQVIVTDDDGPVTGVSALNSNTIIFKAGAIYIVYGVEGTNNGTGNTLTTPAILVSGIGCISPGSIVYTAQGVWFQSARGIELLDLNMSVDFAGEPVKDATSGQTIVAALDYPAQRQIRFFLANGGACVYSTITGEWSTFSYAAIAGPTNAACFYGGAPAWASVGPTFQVETPTLYADASVGGSGGNWIASRFTTGDLQMGEGLQGYRRYVALDLLGTWNSESGLSIILATDYSLTASQLNVFTSAQIEAIPGFDSSRLQVEIRPKIQKAEAVQVTVGDIAPVDGTVGKGIAWESLQFEVVTKQGRYRGLSSAAKG